ncbi:MAG: hypothetical protein M3R15_08035 [Acidobacteriota bacterium]|nr:hypothetical protein [Acidobacteriota bacterium]
MPTRTVSMSCRFDGKSIDGRQVMSDQVRFVAPFTWRRTKIAGRFGGIKNHLKAMPAATFVVL